MLISISDLREITNRLGFQSVGVSPVYQLDEEAKKLELWLSKDYQGEMSFLERYFDLRTDPRKLLPGCKSIIVLSMNYYQAQKHREDSKISRYAYGQDYHKVLKKKAKEIHQWMIEKYGDILFRAFVDSAPIMERVWSEKAGISWNGKNTLSISPGNGSYFFLMCILTDLEVEKNNPIKDHCGTCTRCIDACPTEAIDKNGYLLDASKCISYLTIELKKNIPEEFKNKMENWIFGCDICQEVCPWNRFSKPTELNEFEAKNEILNLNIEDWISLEEEKWLEISKKSPLKRTGIAGIKRNALFIKKYS
ncbi:MAG: tRNA epoxyqueuosine(34) reductase QueG [Saprospiraceae bacterium]|nr:tRNA epoxyqueuosine(34) reductase QueG [Saprospiraceae bacterium]